MRLASAFPPARGSPQRRTFVQISFRLSAAICTLRPTSPLPKRWSRRGVRISFQIRREIAIRYTAQCLGCYELGAHREHHQFGPGHAVRRIAGSDIVREMRHCAAQAIVARSRDLADQRLGELIKVVRQFAVFRLRPAARGKCPFERQLGGQADRLYGRVNIDVTGEDTSSRRERRARVGEKLRRIPGPMRQITDAIGEIPQAILPVRRLRLSLRGRFLCDGSMVGVRRIN